jgi:RNA recognition motif-containing protein
MNIYVGNLSLEVTADELRLEFLSFGQVCSVTVVNDKGIGSGQNRGCGYVEMPSINEAELALEKLQGKLLKGRPIEVIKALPVTRDPHIRQSGGSGISGFFRKGRSKNNRWGRVL